MSPAKNRGESSITPDAAPPNPIWISDLHRIGELSRGIVVQDVSSTICYEPTRRTIQGGRMKQQRLKNLPPPNSLAYYRELRNLSQPELAKKVGCSSQQISRFEKRDSRLTPEWAERLGRALEVSAGDIAYSDAPDAYPWATKVVPVVGSIEYGLKVTLFDQPTERIAVDTGAVTGMSALRYMPGSTSPLDSGVYFQLFEFENKADMSQEILNQQDSGERFIIHLFDGTTWFRRIQNGTRKHRYHLAATGAESILDAEIDWVCRIGGVTLGRKLPSNL